MRLTFLILITLFLAGCSQHENQIQGLLSKIDSLQHKLENSYKPGFGDLMSGIQMHHAKLWFAGQNKNWRLAEFEVHEIEEALEDIQKFNIDRPEAKSISIINPAMDSVKNAIKLEHLQLFKNSYILLTNNCNNCHKETKHEFNVVTIPNSLPVPNQDFRAPK